MEEMASINILTKESASKLITLREGETKFGQQVHYLENIENLEEKIYKSSAQFVLFGIKEDIGVTANCGKKGAKNTWDFALRSILNTQNNCFNDGSKVLILGYLEFPNLYKSLQNDENSVELDKYRKAVESIDKSVTELVNLIQKAGKFHVSIGGGHNNAYGNIKGM